MDNNFVIILRSGETIDVSCGPGQGRAETLTLRRRQRVIVQCGEGDNISQLIIQCRPGNPQEPDLFRQLAKNQTLTVTCD